MLIEEPQVLLLIGESEISLFRTAFVSNAVDYTYEVSGILQIYCVSISLTP